jgi:hypothetical protein
MKFFVSIACVVVFFAMLQTSFAKSPERVELSIQPNVEEPADQKVEPTEIDNAVLAVKNSFDKSPIIWSVIMLATIAYLCKNIYGTLVAKEYDSSTKVVSAKAIGYVMVSVGLLTIYNGMSICFGWNLVMSNVLFFGVLTSVVGYVVIENANK